MTAPAQRVRIYPYDVAPNVDTTGDGVADEGSLRGSSKWWQWTVPWYVEMALDPA